MATFDGDGLVIDRLADIKAQIQTDLRSVYGDGINLAETSPFGVLVGIVAERYYLLWEKLEAIYEASFPNTAFGVYLDELAAFNGITRDSATFSTVLLTFTRSNGISDGDVTVPAGTQVSSGGTSSVVWSTDSELTIPNGSMTANVQATASQSGPIGALAGTLVNMASIPTNVASVTNAADATLGRNEETDSELKLRRQLQLGRSGTSTEAGIRSALINLDQVETASVIENSSSVIDSDGRPPKSFESYVLMEAGSSLGMQATLSFNIDFVTGNAISPTVNGNTLTNVNFDTDQDTTMAVLAAKIQTADEVLTAVYNGPASKSISILGAVNFDFTVSASTTGGASQPADTFLEDVPADVEAMDDIAQAIWDSKAAGIETYGDLYGTATDAAGDPQTMYFTEIEEVQIWLKITLTTNSDYDAATAEPAIRAAIVDWATLNFSVGQDSITYKILCAASDVGLEGIDYIVVEQSTTSDSGPWSTNNVTITSAQIGSIDSADIAFA